MGLLWLRCNQAGDTGPYLVLIFYQGPYLFRTSSSYNVWLVFSFLQKEINATNDELAKARKLVEDLESRQAQLVSQRDQPLF